MYQRVGPKAFKKDLKNIQYLDKYLNHPHRDFKSIHIAGTNGKGSVSFLIASALSAMGYKVGLYTSPHYKDYRERIKVNGALVPKAYVKRFVNKLIEDALFESNFKPSFFEISVAMAFAYFKESKVDYAVIETGLGGRLDSTNIIKPELSVITNIGFDHVQFLGNTIKSIAGEKAGIIKKNIPVVIGKKQKESHPVFLKHSERKSSKLIYASRFKKQIDQNLLPSNLPDFQHENRLTAFAALKVLFEKYDDKKLKQAWSKGLKQWGYMGRYMTISKQPKVIVDSAHNEDGIKYLFKRIEKEKFDHLHIVFAVVNDKDLNQIETYLPRNASYYISAAKIPRAKPAGELSEALNAFGIRSQRYSSVRKALAAAKSTSNKKDLILVAGSIFTVVEVL